jgi:NAD(P)-dependent dehydrogenase (short-subunit alcohol dehydrogenase family)
MARVPYLTESDLAETDRMTDKVSVITGGASGIAEASARQFCDEKGKVVAARVSASARPCWARSRRRHPTSPSLRCLRIQGCCEPRTRSQAIHPDGSNASTFIKGSPVG